MTRRALTVALVLACLWGCTSEGTTTDDKDTSCTSSNCATTDVTTSDSDSVTPTTGDGISPSLDLSQPQDTTPGKDGQIGCTGASCDATQPKTTALYMTFFSHNERTLMRYGRVRESKEGYLTFRNSLIRIAKLFKTYGARYSWQSDYVFLEGIEKYEAEVLKDDPAATNNKPLLVYLSEDLGVSIEVHAHECWGPPNNGDCKDKAYNYADVAYLIKQIGGVEPRGVIGGSSAAERTVGDFANCIKGNVFDSSWCPTILIGYAGDQGGHKGTDDENSGVWNPTEFSNEQFTVHNPNGKLHYVGSGRSLGAFGSTNGAKPLDYIKGLLERIANGTAPAGKIYTASINFNEDMMIDSDYYDELEDYLKAFKPYIDSGQMVYANFPEVVEAWQTVFNSEPNIYSY